MRLRGKTDDMAVGEFFSVRAELDSLLDQEEVYWKQRAKDFWLKEGDKILAISIHMLLRSKSTIRSES